MTRSWESYNQNVFIVYSLYLSTLFGLLCQIMSRRVRTLTSCQIDRNHLDFELPVQYRV